MFSKQKIVPQKYQTIQKISLSVGFLIIFLCLFSNNGIINSNLENPNFITYQGKVITKNQGNTYKFDLECNGQGSNDVNKECQIFKQTIIFAILSLVFGGAALLLTFLTAKQEKLSIFILIFILVPLIFTIMMPTWKLIYANDILTYRLAPLILEFSSFILYFIAISQIILKQKYRANVGLLQ